MKDEGLSIKMGARFLLATMSIPPPRCLHSRIEQKTYDEKLTSL